MKTFIILICLGILTSCKPVKILDSKDNLDKTEKDDGYLFYPRQGEIYLSNIEDLIGNYVVIEPGPDGKGQSWSIGRAITDQGIAAISKNDLSQQDPPYKSRITGGFSSNLSFAVGTANFNTDFVYDVILKKNNSALIPQEFRYIDDRQFNNIYTRVPQKYYALFFITGIEYRTLSYKEYAQATVEANVGLTAVKVNGKVYYSNEQINSIPVIYYTGIVESMRFGDFNSQDSLYYKKQTIPQLINPQIVPSQVPKDLILQGNQKIQNLKIIRKAKPRI